MTPAQAGQSQHWWALAAAALFLGRPVRHGQKPWFLPLWLHLHRPISHFQAFFNANLVKKKLAPKIVDKFVDGCRTTPPNH